MLPVGKKTHNSRQIYKHCLDSMVKKMEEYLCDLHKHKMFKDNSFLVISLFDCFD